jgi:4-amino-4-deoxy-L-arabinose transferase-like glycosyltransferase
MATPVDESRSHRARFLILALLSALLLFPSLHRRGLAGYDDAVYAHEGKEMVRTGDWWNIRFNGNLNFEYPPLFLWLEAGSFKLFGVNDAAAKFPSALLGFGTIVLVYFLTLELTGQRWLSLLAMLVLASTQFFLKNAAHAMTDVPFTFFFTLVIFFYLKGLKNNVYLLLLGLPAGLALLTRSVIGFLAIAIIVLHLVVTKRRKVLWSPWFISGLALALAIPSIWYISQYRLHGAASFAAHFRFVMDKIHAESGSARWLSIFNYPEALLKYYWPWLPFLIAGLWMEVRAWIKQKDEAASLLIVWVLLVLLPFSLVQTRYPRYIMPVFPAFSILAAISLDRLIPVSRRRTFFALACASGVLAIILTFVFPPKARAEDILALVPVAEANSSPEQRILVYSYEDGRSDYLNQFLWYSSRYAELPADLHDLSRRLAESENGIVIIDKPSYAKLSHQIQPRTPQILGQSENFVCFRSQ